MRKSGKQKSVKNASIDDTENGHLIRPLLNVNGKNMNLVVSGYSPPERRCKSDSGNFSTSERQLSTSAIFKYENATGSVIDENVGFVIFL